MTATDELRRLLDECGVEWKEHRHQLAGSMALQLETLWGQPVDNTSGKQIQHVYHYRATEMGDGRLFLEAQLVTPEQAIAATLGWGTCQLKPWEMERDTGFYDCMECACGYVADVADWAEWHFCPNCGRRVDE